MSFTTFVSLVGRIPDCLADGHFKSQYAWLYRLGKRIPDYVGKLEELPESWSVILLAVVVQRLWSIRTAPTDATPRVTIRHLTWSMP